MVTGDGGVLVTGCGGGVLGSVGGGAVAAEPPGSGAVVAGGTAAGAVGNGDGRGASAEAPGVTGTGSAGVVPGGSGGMTRSGRPGPPVAAGTVMVTAAPGRACTVPVGAVCHSHSATPVVATATVAVGTSSHGDSSQPNRSRRCRPTRGRPRRGGPDVVANQSPNASDWSAGRHLPDSGSGGVTGAAGRSRTGRRRTPAVHALPGRRRGGSRCGRRAGP